MKLCFSAIAIIATTGATSAQTLGEGIPYLDPSAPYEITGVSPGGVFVTSEAGVFHCEVDERPSVFVLEGCRPVVSAFVGDAIQNEAQAAIDTIEIMPPFMMATTLQSALAKMPNCRIDGYNLDQFIGVWAQEVNISPGLAAIEEVTDTIGDRFEGAAEMLVERGEMVLNEDQEFAVLTNCPQ